MSRLFVIFSLIYFCLTASLAQQKADVSHQKIEKNSSLNDTVKSPSPSNSVLANGKWYRFSVDTTGVYKITPDFLEKLGMDVSKINPADIKIYGNGGKMLPLSNNANYEFDLKENTIAVVGGEDGKLSGIDHILFYGEGTTGYSKENNTHLNLYDDRSYYFITADGHPGKRIANYTIPKKKADTLITSFTDYQFYEVDATNMNTIGRRWFGDALSDTANTFNFKFPNRLIDKPVTCTIVVGTQYFSTFTIDVMVNRKTVGALSFQKGNKNTIGSEKKFQKTITTSEEHISIALAFQKIKFAHKNTYLDYIGISAERALETTNGQMSFEISPVKANGRVGEINVNNSLDNPIIWNVTDIGAITEINHVEKKNKLNFSTYLDTKQRFIILDGKKHFQPGLLKNPKVANQNLKGEIFLNKSNKKVNLDYLIITTKKMIPAAERLANFRRDNDQLNVKVVDVQHIYNEFSSGKQDIVAIRNFIRYIYENAPDQKSRLKYVCLFGDASIDYKNNRIKIADYLITEKNSIPSYESLQAFSKTSSYVSDDFFVSLAPESGELKSSDKLFVAIGRIPVNSFKNAQEVVSKIIEYESEKSYGLWRNQFVLISDDVDKYWERMIQENLNRLGDTIRHKYPFFSTTKFLSDAFIQKSLPTGESYPELRERLMSEIKDGVGIINYFGHATEDGLSTEFFLTSADVKSLDSNRRYPFFITVTCLATRFDNPIKTSFGEHLFRNPKGGAIGMITTTREIFSRVGVTINKTLIKHLFSDKGGYVRPSEALKKMKNELSSNHKRSVFFIGDPAMQLQIPKKRIEVKRINDIPVDKFNDTLKAGNKVKLSGIVVNDLGTIRKKYRGNLLVKIFDKEITRRTRANDGIKNGKGELITLEFKNNGPLIFHGFSTVKNGKFTIEFVVPRDINMQIGKCKILLYSKENDKLNNYFGVYENAFLGGIQTQQISDMQGPKIEMYIATENDENQELLDMNSTLHIQLSDESGINLASGIGHDITGIVDSNYDEPILLTDRYKNYGDSYQKGEILYSLSGLQPGKHTFTVKVWDTHNNISSKKIEFRIKKTIR